MLKVTTRSTTDLNNLIDGANGQVSIGTPNQHAVTIQDDDVATISFASTGSSVGESAGTHSVDVTIDIPGGGSLLRAISVDVELNTGSPGTALAAIDHNFTSETVTFFVAPFATTKSVTLNILSDLLVEEDETISLVLANLAVPAGALVSLAPPTAPPAHEVTIVDDDTASFTIGDVSVAENAGTMTFTVSLSNPLDIAVDVDVTYADVTATGGGTDFDSATDTITFPVGSTTSQMVTVAITDDNIAELTETFTASLSINAGTPTGTRSVTISDTGTGTITDNDGSPDVQIGDVTG